MGSTRIVTEIAGQRVEGGGQPEINNQLSQQPVAQTAGGGSATPSIAAEIEAPSVADNRSGSSKSKAADRPTPLADSSLNAQPDRFQTESGEPDRDRADDVAIDATPGEPGDSMLARNESDEDDEEELQRQLQELANRNEGSSMAIESNAEPNLAGSSAGTAPAPATASTTLSSRMGKAASLADDSSIKANDGRSAAQKQSSSRSRDTASTSQPGDSTGPRLSSNNRSEAAGSTSVAEAPAESVSGGAQPVIDQPIAAVSGQVAGATGQSRQINDASKLSELDRDAPAGMALNVESRPGAAGVGDLPEPDAGIDSRRAPGKVRPCSRCLKHDFEKPKRVALRRSVRHQRLPKMRFVHAASQGPPTRHRKRKNRLNSASRSWHVTSRATEAGRLAVSISTTMTGQN